MNNKDLPKPRGTQTFSKAQHWAMSSKGGRSKVPTKGFGKLTPEQRIENGKRAYRIKMEKRNGTSKQDL